ncbi:MAG: hypothetical protein ACK5WS_06785 [Alphaproteobacteria bacterium]|jgi:hypothetical protein|nr:hypothetical protein [Candidatus Jidaibacter sp.]
MLKIRTTLSLMFFGLALASCTTQDSSMYDIKSPCVSSGQGIYLDEPCERRLPLENLYRSGIIAAS